MTVWHLHCRSALLRLHQLSPACFLMSSLLTFYQLPDNGVTGGQAPSSTGLQWRGGSSAKVCCMRVSKRNGERDKPNLLIGGAASFKRQVSCLDTRATCVDAEIKRTIDNSERLVGERHQMGVVALTSSIMQTLGDHSSAKRKCPAYLNGGTYNVQNITFPSYAKQPFYSLRSIIHFLACISNYWMSFASFQQF